MNISYQLQSTLLTNMFNKVNYAWIGHIMRLEVCSKKGRSIVNGHFNNLILHKLFYPLDFKILFFSETIGTLQDQ